MTDNNEADSTCANPLFLQWVGEWLNDAVRQNSKTQYTLKKAYSSLQRHPLRLETAQEATQLQGIGQSTAARLAKRLSSWRREQGLDEVAADNDGSTPNGPSTSSQQQRATRVYIPRYKSGAFAILIGLYKALCTYGPDYYIPKDQLIPLCEPYSSTPFAVSGSGHGRSRGAGSAGAGFGNQYTAWSGMKTLELKSLADRQGGVKFSLTDEGLDIARKVVDVLRARNELTPDDAQLFADHERKQTEQPHATIAPRAPQPSASQPLCDTAQDCESMPSLESMLHYPRGSYDVILLIDNREIHSAADRTAISKELEEHHISLEIRPLTVGDYLWIARATHAARHRNMPDAVLDYVVERKRMDDLCASICDGRYKEQHSRIRAAGFSHVFYVVEGCDPDAVRRVGEAAVSSAMSRVQVINGFHMKRTQTFIETLRFLRRTTRLLQAALDDLYVLPDALLEGRSSIVRVKKNVQARFPLARVVVSFDAYESVSSKSASLTVGELYLRMLTTVRGVSADKALTIGRRFAVPRLLLKELKRPDRDAAKTLAEILVDGSTRKIGPALGKRIANFWTSDSFDNSS